MAMAESNSIDNPMMHYTPEAHVALITILWTEQIGESEFFVLQL